jgi:hypothetical protein
VGTPDITDVTATAIVAQVSTAPHQGRSKSSGKDNGMTKRQALAEFRANFDTTTTDKPAIRQAWNDYTDYLCKAGLITQHQYDTWLGPPEGR